MRTPIEDIPRVHTNVVWNSSCNSLIVFLRISFSALSASSVEFTASLLRGSPYSGDKRETFINK